MQFTDEEIFKLLKIQAATLMKLDKLAKRITAEIADQKHFLKEMFRNMDQTRAHEEKEELSETQELPSNVLSFPAGNSKES